MDVWDMIMDRWFKVSSCHPQNPTRAVNVTSLYLGFKNAYSRFEGRQTVYQVACADQLTHFPST